MFVHFDGHIWCKHTVLVKHPNRHMVTLTDAEVSNIPLARLSHLAHYMGSVTHIFNYPATTLSPRFVDEKYVWMSKYEDLMAPFVAGTHSRLGSASLVHALSGHPEILQMIGEGLA